MAPKSKPEAAPEATPSAAPAEVQNVSPAVPEASPEAGKPGVRVFTKDGVRIKETTKANGIVVTSYLGKEA